MTRLMTCDGYLYLKTYHVSFDMTFLEVLVEITHLWNADVKVPKSLITTNIIRENYSLKVYVF